MDPVTGIKYSKACDQLGTIREFMAYYLRTFCNLKLSRNVLISSICYFYQQWGDIPFCSLIQIYSIPFLGITTLATAMF